MSDLRWILAIFIVAEWGKAYLEKAILVLRDSYTILTVCIANITWN